MSANPDILYETERLLIQPTVSEHAALMLELLNTPKWLRYIGDRKVYTLEAARKYIDERITPQFERLGFGSYTLVKKDDGARIGTCGLYDRAGVEGIDVGFALLPAYEGQGYAFEATKWLISQAIRVFGLERLSAITLEDNFSSQKLLERLHFRPGGSVRLPGDTVDLMLYIYP